MPLLRVPSRRTSFNFFDSETGHIYYLNKNTHECVYHSIGKYFGDTYVDEQCEATYENCDDQSPSAFACDYGEDPCSVEESVKHSFALWLLQQFRWFVGHVRIVEVGLKF